MGASHSQNKTHKPKKPPRAFKIICWPYGSDQLQPLSPSTEQSTQLNQFKWLFGLPFALLPLAILYQSWLHNAVHIGVFVVYWVILAGCLIFHFFGAFSEKNIAQFKRFTFLLPRRLSSVVFTQRGIEFGYTFGTLTTDTWILRWKDIEDVYMRRKSSRRLSDFELCFGVHDGTAWAITSQQIATKKQWKDILDAIDRWSPVRPKNLDRGAFDHLAPSDLLLANPSTPTFTTLWLQAFHEPPKRHRLEPLRSGTILQEGRYVIKRQIGVGGQGRAYLAKNKDGSTVVVKEYLLPIYVDIQARRQAIASFEHEASMLSSLDHPNIVKLIEFFSEDHRAYLVLKHIDGRSLRKIVDSGETLGWRKVVEYGEKMCDILTYLHARTPPIVHGDFTPDNLIVRSDETLMLIDFTIARQSDETITSIVAGKSAYMPPEQYRGIINVQTDIYALGGTLYFLLTSEDPEPLSCMHPVLQREDTDIDLDKIIAKCTALESRERYQSAEQVKDLLHKLAT
jgi:tRNA A-37 threonylcarbamoyl transferase component Bud32